jgi:serine protease
MNRFASLVATSATAGLVFSVACVEVETSVSTQAVRPVKRVIAKYENDDGRRAAVAAAVEVHHDLARHKVLAISVPEAAINGLIRHPDIEFVEEDARREPYAESMPYGISMVQADLLSDDAAANQTVCIIDSGYSFGHPDLPTATVSGGSDSGTGKALVDECGHGTHVAGTVAALANGHGVVGVLPNGAVKLHIVKVFSGAGCGWSYSSTLIAALDECRDFGATVVSMSLGGTLSSRAEQEAFDEAFAAGVLSIAAAGNSGNTRKSYPASYDGVVSVAAVDSGKNVALFSQKNDQVELAAPGVGVKSTYLLESGTESTVAVADLAVQANAMGRSAIGAGSGPLVDCGLAESPCPSSVGAVCLIQRGNVSFHDKVENCALGGGVGAIIYNNVAGSLAGTLGDTPSAPAASIPSVGVSDAEGAALLSRTGQHAEVAVSWSDYIELDGTSMATPHVSGVAALVWSRHPSCTAAEIRAALAASAEDLGAAGRDNAYGFGLVQAVAADEYLTSHPCSAELP